MKEASDVPISAKTAIEDKGTVITSSDWVLELDPIIQHYLTETGGKGHKKYNGKKVEDILRLIRNCWQHYNTLTPEVRGTFVRGIQESLEKGLVEYFLEKFPSLLLHTFTALEPCKSDDLLSDFYDKDYSFA